MATAEVLQTSQETANPYEFEKFNAAASLQINNGSQKAIVYKLKCAHPTVVLTSPAREGVLNPQESKLIQFFLKEKQAASAGVEVTFYSMYVSTQEAKQGAAALWRNAARENRDVNQTVLMPRFNEATEEKVELLDIVLDEKETKVLNYRELASPAEIGGVGHAVRRSCSQMTQNDGNRALLVIFSIVGFLLGLMIAFEFL